MNPRGRVVIVGRPNVGKSAVFNRLLGRRRSLVHDVAGMTRDVLVEEARLPDDRPYDLVDTGGFDPSEKEEIPAAVRRLALEEIERASLVLLVVDASAGVLPADREAARVVRRAGRACVVLANKIDRRAGSEGEADAYALGFPEVFGVSAEHNLGFDELLDEMSRRLPPPQEEGESAPPAAAAEIAVAIIGRPNVGKSSLLNALVGAERTIVSESAGTTRDSVDALVEAGGRRFRFVDTAGIRRKGKTEAGPEVLSVVAAQKRVQRCDVALVVFDAVEGVTSQDSSVAAYAAERGKGIVLVANKWDLVEHAGTNEEFSRDVYDKLPFARYAPILRVSARGGRGVGKLPGLIARVADNRERRLPTAELNRTLGEEARRNPPRGQSKRALKVLYVSQTGTAPPIFTLAANREEPLYFSDARRLENVVRRAGDFTGVPIQIKVAGRRRNPRGGKNPLSPRGRGHDTSKR
jgi:GTP-binding protein